MIFLIWLGWVLVPLLEVGRPPSPPFVRRRGFTREPSPDHPP